MSLQAQTRESLVNCFSVSVQADAGAGRNPTVSPSAPPSSLARTHGRSSGSALIGLGRPLTAVERFLNPSSLCPRPAEETGLCDGTVQLGTCGGRGLRLQRVFPQPQPVFAQTPHQDVYVCCRQEVVHSLYGQGINHPDRQKTAARPRCVLSLPRRLCREEAAQPSILCF